MSHEAPRSQGRSPGETFQENSRRFPGSAPSCERPASLGSRFTVVLLLALGLLVFLGTLAAAQDGVLAAQERYFDPLLAWQPVGAGLSLPLPGARLLLLALFAALVLDRAAWRFRPGARALPLVHAGVAVLLASGLWSAWSAREGSATVPAGGAVRVAASGDGATLPLPFTLHLREVVREYHPGTPLPARFEVRVEVESPGAAPLPARIALHAPLHRGGFAVHLRGEPPGMLPASAPVELVFRRDPAAGPRLFACGLLALGLLAHFGWLLLRERGRRPD